jgi:hypothetical protein
VDAIIQSSEVKTCSVLYEQYIIEHDRYLYGVVRSKVVIRRKKPMDSLSG